MSYIVEPQVQEVDGTCALNVTCPKVLCVGNCPNAACQIKDSSCDVVCSIYL